MRSKEGPSGTMAEDDLGQGPSAGRAPRSSGPPFAGQSAGDPPSSRSRFPVWLLRGTGGTKPLTPTRRCQHEGSDQGRLRTDSPNKPASSQPARPCPQHPRPVAWRWWGRSSPRDLAEGTRTEPGQTGEQPPTQGHLPHLCVWGPGPAPPSPQGKTLSSQEGVLRVPS